MKTTRTPSTDPKEEARRKLIVAMAQKHDLLDEGTLEVDDDAIVSEGEDNGAYVQAWLWVGFEGTPLEKEVDDESEEDEE